jgi:iron(III) transport system substrate-binding protein
MARRVFGVVLVLALLSAACGDDGAASGGSVSDGSLTIYSGRAEALVGSLIDQFESESGVDVQVKYGGTPELANAILEEGANTPADVFFAQDAGSLGALVDEDRLSAVDQRFLDRVAPRFRSDDGLWVGISGRVRVVAYNPERVKKEELPASVLGFTDPKWKRRVGWAPTNGSFQAFLTALRLLKGEETARQWVKGLSANNAAAYPNNITIVQAVSDGEIDVGLVNHYYLYELKKQNRNLKADNYFLGGGDPGGLVNVAGVGILKGTKHQDEAERFLDFMLAKKAQEHFANETFEYPLIDGVAPPAGAPPLDSLDPPDVDLSDLADLRGTQDLLTETGVL